MDEFFTVAKKNCEANFTKVSTVYKEQQLAKVVQAYRAKVNTTQGCFLKHNQHWRQ